MDRKKLFKRLSSLIFFIFVVNFLADKFYWYFSIWYLDMIMHFLGGFWIGLTFFYFFPNTLESQKLSLGLILKIILGVLLIGIAWEIFEFIFNNYFAQNPFNSLDTTSDIFFDIAGGAFAILYFLKRIMLQLEDSL